MLGRLFYDIAVSFETIEHVEKPYEFMRILNRLVRLGGYVVISTPNFFLFKLLGKNYWGVNPWVEHLHFFEPEEVVKMLKECGFETVFMTTTNSLGLGKRLKIQLIHVNTVKKVWNLIKLSPILYTLKDLIFAICNRIKTKEDRLHLSGNTILCIGKKMYQSSE